MIPSGSASQGEVRQQAYFDGWKKYDKFFIYVPTELAKDSQFPFRDGDEVTIVVKAKGIEIVKSR